MKGKKLLPIIMFIVIVALMLSSCALSTLDTPDNSNPPTESGFPINPETPVVATSTKTVEPTVVPSNTATDIPALTPTQTLTQAPTETPVPPTPTFIPQRELSIDESLLLVGWTSSILIDPEYEGPLKWEERDHYRWCEVLYRNMDSYGWSVFDKFEDETWPEVIESYYNSFAWGDYIDCPQFVGSAWIPSESSWEKHPPIEEPYPELDWSANDEKFVFGIMLQIYADPAYPGPYPSGYEDMFQPIDADLWCSVLWNNFEIYGGLNRGELPDYLRWAMVDLPAEYGDSPICYQFAGLTIQPTAIPTYSPYPPLDWWTDEDLGYFSMLYRDIVEDSTYTGPVLGDNFRERRYEACQILFDYGQEYGTYGETPEERWQFILDILWSGDRYLCPQFEE
jgi:hypothetical protein